MKKLYRNTETKIIGGVCSGISDYFQIDPVIIRLIWACSILIYGVGLLAYVLAWIIIPRADQEEDVEIFNEMKNKYESVKESSKNMDKGQALGIGLVVLGLLFILHRFNLIPFEPAIVFALALIVVGIYFIVQKKK